MAGPKLSVVVPTRNRPERLQRTLAALVEQQGLDPKEYEVIVVDDGSTPPVTLSVSSAEPRVMLLRLEGEERSVARNHGAERARGELLVFVDDDMRVSPTFLASHWDAHLHWPRALHVGSVQLPDVATTTPFGAFRQRLEANGVPDDPGPVARNICTAQNMAIEQGVFHALGGFDPGLSVAEDQDFALRHTAHGGRIVFVPNAAAIHDDSSALTLRSYCQRYERYMEELVRFSARHPELPDNVQRARVNGFTRLGREPATLSARKLLKVALIWRPVRAAALSLVSVVERLAPNSKLLDRLYRMLLGAHLQRGYRRGLRSAYG